MSDEARKLYEQMAELHDQGCKLQARDDDPPGVEDAIRALQAQIRELEVQYKALTGKSFYG